MELYKLYFDYILLERGLSKNTFLAYKRDIEQFYNHFGKLDVPEEDVQEYFLSLPCSSSTISRKISAINNMYRFLLLNNYISNNPLRDIVNIKKEKKLPIFLTNEEIKKVSDEFFNDTKGRRDRMIFDLLIYTGARVSEVVNLKLRDIDWNYEVIRYFGKNSKVRAVPVSKQLLNKIKLYIDEIRPIYNIGNDDLFPKMSRNNYFHRLREYVRKSGVKKSVSPHVLRHSFATIMLANGANIRHVQELLGHSSISTTEIYTHSNKDKLKKAYDKVDFS